MTLQYLDAEAILTKAATDNDLLEFVDDGLRGRFSTIIASFNRNGVIPEEERDRALAQISRGVVARLRLERDWKQNPEILDEKIEKPIFISGSPRTGTTILQCLLGEDPGNRILYYWQAGYPSPPPGLAPETVPGRIALETRYVERYTTDNPRWLPAHPYLDQGGLSELEDEDVFSTDFHCAFPQRYIDVPVLPVWIPPSDPAGRFPFHKKFLQHMQWRLPKRKWVCKGTSHQFDMPVLWEVYPDASCIWPHRDPVAFIGSLLELLDVIYKNSLKGETKYEFGLRTIEYVKQGYDQALASNWIDDERLIHIRFKDMNRDQIGTIRRVYDRLGLSVTDEFQDNIRKWLADPSHKSDRHGKFDYSLERFGFSAAEIRQMFQNYYERFVSD